MYQEFLVHLIITVTRKSSGAGTWGVLLTIGAGPLSITCLIRRLRISL
jgi:hypothetical protein